MCSGMVPLWAELFYWICAPTSFIRRRFGSAPLDLRSRPMYMSFSTPSNIIVTTEEHNGTSDTR